MRAAAVKSQLRNKNQRNNDNDKKDKSLAVIQLERLKYKTFIDGVNSINNILDKHKLKQDNIINETKEETNTKVDDYIFRPYGQRKVIWDIWIGALIIYSIVSIPFKIGFQVQSDINDKIFDYIVDCFFFMDILMNFNTAITTDNDQLIANRTTIALKYFQFWFWLDMASTVPIDDFVEIVLSGDNGNGLSAIRLIRIIRLIRLLKLARVFRLRSIGEHLESLNINPSILNVSKLIFQIFFIAHIVSCFWYFLTTGDVVGYNESTGEKQQVDTWITNFPAIESGSISDQYIASLYWTVATMVAVGYGDIHAVNIQERVFAIVIMLGGGILFGAIIGETTRAVESRNPQAKLMKEKLNNLKGYLAEKSLPLELKIEAKTAYIYYLQRNISFGEQLFSDLPIDLKEKLVFKVFEKEIVGIKIFRNYEKMFVIRLVQNCQPMYSKVDEILYDFGDVTNEFVFIMKGLVSISSVESKNVSILAGYATEGSYFMDFEYLMNTLSIARYRTVEQSNLFVVKYNAVAEACSDLVESGINFKEELHRRYKNFKDVLKLTAKTGSSSAHKAYSNSIAGNSKQMEYSRLLFWVDGYPCETFDRHRNEREEGSKDLTVVRIIVKDAEAKHVVIKVPRKELIKRHIVHPDGEMKLRWDGIVGALILYSVFYIPVQMAFTDPVSSDMSYFENVMDAFFVSDIVVSGRTAYYDDSEDAYMTDPLKIYDRYLKTWFFIDFFSGVPFDAIILSVVDGSSTNLVSLRLIKVVRLMRLLKLVRLLKLSKYIYKLEDAFDIPPSVFELLVLILRVLLFGHFIACFWWGMTSFMSDDPWFVTTELQPQGTTFLDSATAYKYVASLYWTFTTLATVGYGDLVSSNTNERVLNVFIMLIGATTFGYIVANVSNTFGSLNQTQVLKRDKMSNITSILAEKNVPVGLTTSIVDHFKILYKKISAFDEESVLSGLPQRISNRISIAIHNETMNRIKLFSYIDNQSVALFIFNILQPSTFQPGQAIMKEGTAALEITFLESGAAIAFRALKDNKRRAYFLNWKTGSKSKTSTFEQVYPEQCAQLEFTSTRSATLMRKDRLRGISIHNKVAPVSDTDTKVDAMHSIVPSASELDDGDHDGSIVDNDDQDYSLFSEKIREKLVDIKDGCPDFKDDEIIDLGYEPVARYSACDFFGHASILKEANNHATVMALRACSTYTLKKSEIVKLAMNNPPISMILQAAIGKAIHSLRQSKGKEMVRQERAKFLTTIKSKHIGYKNRRRIVEDEIKKKLEPKRSTLIAPIRNFSFRNIRMTSLVRVRSKTSKWEIVRRAITSARAAATVTRMTDGIVSDHPMYSEIVATKRDDYFKKAISAILGGPLDLVLNETTIQYDSDSSDDDRNESKSKEVNSVKARGISDDRIKINSETRSRTRTSSGAGFSLIFSSSTSANNNSLNVVKEEVSLSKLKKAALIQKCISLSSIDKALEYAAEFGNNPSNTERLRRNSYPSFNINAWKRNRLDEAII